MLAIHPLLDLNDLRAPAWQIIWVLVHNLLLYCSHTAHADGCSQTTFTDGFLFTNYTPADVFLFINCSYLFYLFRWDLVHNLVLQIGSCSQSTLKDGFLSTNCYCRWVLFTNCSCRWVLVHKLLLQVGSLIHKLLLQVGSLFHKLLLQKVLVHKKLLQLRNL